MGTLRETLKNSTRFAWERLEARVGRLWVVQRHRRLQQRIPSVEQSISAIAKRWEFQVPESDEGPIFILSAGWRSGSTMLQRLIVSSGRACIWGEPYDHCDFTRRLANALKPFSDDYPPASFLTDQPLQAAVEELAATWIANLYPHPSAVHRAHRAFFETLYAEPANAAGFPRWGFKEVRLSLDYAMYLKWVFPNARFLLLYRNPYAAYRSYRAFRSWYDRWPAEAVHTPAQFGRVWNEIATSFVEGHERLGGLLVKFEDLVGGQLPVSRISEYLNLPLTDEVLTKRIGGRGPMKSHDVPAFEQRLLRRAVEPLASQLGYTQ